MFNHIGLRGKLLAVISVPMACLFFFGAYLTYQKYQSYSSAKGVLLFAEYTLESGKLVKLLAEERGVSAGFVKSRGKYFSTQLPTQQNKTDQQVAEFYAYLKDVNMAASQGEVTASIQGVKQSLEELVPLRKQVKSLSVGVGTVIAHFSKTIQFLLKPNQLLGSTNRDKDMARGILELDNIMRGIDYAGLQRALMSNIFGDEGFDEELLKQIRFASEFESVYLQTFLRNAGKRQIATWENQSKDPSFAGVAKYKARLFDHEKKTVLTGSLLSSLGYGGLIHHFKNFVLRGTPKYAEQAKAAHGQGAAILGKLEKIPTITNTERERLATVRSTIDQYLQGVQTVEAALSRGVPISKLDQLVKVNDGPALKAIEAFFSRSLGVNPEQWFQVSTHRIDLMNKMDQVTQSNAANAEEPGSSSHLVSDQAGRMTSMVEVLAKIIAHNQSRHNLAHSPTAPVRAISSGNGEHSTHHGSQIPASENGSY